jgi:hypothetical protein
MSKTKSLKRTAFVPRLAYGCVGLGMGVIPLSVGCTAATAGSTDPPPIGISPYIPPDASTDADASFIGIIPYIPDAAADNDVPDVPDANGDGDGGDGDVGLTTDASGD